MKKEKIKKYDVIFGLIESNTKFIEYFIGNLYLILLTNLTENSIYLANVMFRSRCINSLHISNLTV